MCTHCQEWIKKKWLGAAKQKNLESPSIPTSVLHEYNNLYVKSARLLRHGRCTATVRSSY